MIKQLKLFTPIFICLLFLDIYVKINLPIMPYRYVTKSLVIVSLLLFVGYNCFIKNNYKDHLLFYGLIIFYIGDFLTVDHINNITFIVSIILFLSGKILYTLKFTHKEDFNIMRLFPFMLLCFLYVAFLYELIFHNLKIYFIPVTIYFFISLLMILFAFIRKGVVSNVSYYTVMSGVLLFILFETVLVIKTFYHDILYQDFLIMFCYALGQYLIVIGIMIEEKNLDVKNNIIA